MTFVFWVLWLILLIPTLYWVFLAIASIYTPRRRAWQNELPQTRFAIAIPAHNEETVIAETVNRLQELDYPAHLFSVFIVADHCSDQTANKARAAGATVFERKEGPRSGKGAALSWLFQKIFADPTFQAIVIFDADTRVDKNFLRVMDARLREGSQVIQGQHRIRNENDGWFPLLTWAMFLIDNRYQNLGRNNLGCSAKHMGDSICFRTEVLRKLGWGEGLTEDYQLRQRLLLEGIRIEYEPEALGLGEAPLTWQQARAQRARWLRGTRDASRTLAPQLLKQGIRKQNLAMLEGALQAYFPSFSTLSVIAVFFFFLLLLLYWTGKALPPSLLAAWGGLVMVLVFYPFGGLVLEKAPFKAFLAILTGPYFILWRTALALQARLSRKPVVWIRTAHGRGK